jgi:hypothetical protein
MHTYMNINKYREREGDREERPGDFVISLDFADFGEEALEKQIIVGGGGGSCIAHRARF